MTDSSTQKLVELKTDRNMNDDNDPKKGSQSDTTSAERIFIDKQHLFELSSIDNCQKLYLNGKWSNDDDTKYLLKSIPSSLTSIDFHDTALSDESLTQRCKSVGIDSLASFFNEHRSNGLCSLNMSQCGLTNVERFCSMLKDNTQLREINLSHNFFGNTETFPIAEMIRENKSLTRVHLMSRIVGDVGRRSIFDAMATNRFVREFYCGIVNEEVAFSFAQMIHHNQTLEKLIIYVDQQMSNTATDLIFNAVKQSKSLKSFENVASDWFTLNINGTTLANLIRCNSTLTRLAIVCHCELEKPAIGALETTYSLLDINIARPTTTSTSTTTSGLSELQNSIAIRNRELQWKKVHRLIVDCVVAMAPLNLPAYVLLWIVDALPHIEFAVRHFKKITLIIALVDSIRATKKRTAKRTRTDTK